MTARRPMLDALVSMLTSRDVLVSCLGANARHLPHMQVPAPVFALCDAMGAAIPLALVVGQRSRGGVQPLVHPAVVARHQMAVLRSNHRRRRGSRRVDAGADVLDGRLYGFDARRPEVGSCSGPVAAVTRWGSIGEDPGQT